MLCLCGRNACTYLAVAGCGLEDVAYYYYRPVTPRPVCFCPGVTMAIAAFGCRSGHVIVVDGVTRKLKQARKL